MLRQSRSFAIHSEKKGSRFEKSEIQKLTSLVLHNESI